MNNISVKLKFVTHGLVTWHKPLSNDFSLKIRFKLTKYYLKRNLMEWHMIIKVMISSQRAQEYFEKNHVAVQDHRQIM